MSRTWKAWLAASCAALTWAQAPAKLDLKPLPADAGYMPAPPVELSPERPVAIRQEPAYKGKPLYGSFRLGNGPRAVTYFVIDSVAQGDDRIFIDRNQNGDLRDDGDGNWDRRSENRVIGYYSYVTLHASYGTATEERASAAYTLGLYFAKGTEELHAYSYSERVGTLELEGKSYEAHLREMDGDALFRKPAATVEEARKTRPVNLTLSRAGADGKPERAWADLRGPFKLGEKAYEAEVADDGSTLALKPTTKPVVNLTPPPPPPPAPLAAGTPAPDYSFELWGGKRAKLSDYKGKVVVLDFWATWCGPCQQSMPHVEQIHKAVKGQPVEVLAVCVYDTRKAYDRWVPANQGKYTFPLAFDDSGKGDDSQATRLWKVRGIPTTFILDKDGKLAETIGGYNAKGDARIETALKKLGIKLD